AMAAVENRQVNVTKLDNNACFLVMDVTSLFFALFLLLFTQLLIFLIVRKNSTATAPPSSCLLRTYLSDKGRRHGQRTVDDHQRKRRKPPRRRAEHHFRALPRVIFGIVADAFENVLVAAVLFHPGGDRATGMGADRGIGDDAVGRVPARGLVEFGGIEFYDEDLVEPRAVADHRALGILWPGSQHWAAELQVSGLDDVAGAIAFGNDQQVALLRPFVAAGRIVVGVGRNGYEACAARKRGQQQRASRTVRAPRHRLELRNDTLD